MNGGRAVKAGLTSVSIVALVFAAVSGCASGSSSPGAAPTSSAPPAPTVSPAPGSSSPTVAPTPSMPRNASPTAQPTSPDPTLSEQIVHSRVAYEWAWPNSTGSGRVGHTYASLPVPELVRIGIGDHPHDPGERPFNRISFTFTTAFPTYRFVFTQQLTADPGGKTVPLAGMGVLSIVFSQAQAHTADGTASSIVTQSGRPLHLTRVVDYAQAGDFERVLTYGVGVAWPVKDSNPQPAVRVYEVEQITAGGHHLYTVAFDFDATNPVS